MSSVRVSEVREALNCRTTYPAMIVGRFFYEAMLRSRTYYGLTNERVIIISGLFSRTVKSLLVQTLADVSSDGLPESSSKYGLINVPNQPPERGQRGEAQAPVSLDGQHNCLSRGIRI
jgi:hypothetical protein